MFYDDPIDRDHSQTFSLVQDTEDESLLGLVDAIWNSFPEETRNKIDPSGSNAANKRGKSTLKLVIVQLFGVWVVDPTKALNLPTSHNQTVGSIYNPKRISPKKLRRVLEALLDNSYVTKINHSNPRNGSTGPRTTKRIRADKRLHDLFSNLTTTEFDLFEDPNDPLVRLNEFVVDPITNKPAKDKQGKKITKLKEYDTKLPHVVEMVHVLKAYNQLLRRTHIHLANIDKPYITRTKKNGDEINVQITNSNKTVRRVFSRGEWTCYGRFHGGFWQSVGDKDTDEIPYRRHIRINNEPTVELDYSSLHPNMIRVENDLDPAEDIYTIGYQVLDRFDQNEQRQIIKGLVLNLLNADNIDGAYSAYRRRNVTNKFGKITNDQCNKLVDAIKKLQPELADNFGKDRGVDLMFKDSQVIEQIIILATTNDIPVLTVHDSVICRERDEEALRSFMKIATYKILSTQLNFDINRTSMMRTVQSTQQEDKKLFERLYHEALKQRLQEPTTFHIRHWEKFQTYIEDNKNRLNNN